MNTVEQITARQLEVARLVAEGRSNPEIAEALGVSLAGAKYHVSELLGRLGVTSRDEIAEWYRRHGHESVPARAWRRRARALVPFGALIGAAVFAAAIFVALSGGRDDSGAPVAARPATATAVPTEPVEGGPPGLADTSPKTPLFFEYEIQPNDMPEDIARLFGVSVETVIFNNIDMAPTGESNSFVQILVPGTIAVVPTVDGILHTVSDADTVASIAAMYEADEDDILEFSSNGIGDPNDLEPGALILVPGGTRAAAMQGAPAPEGDQWTWPLDGDLLRTFGPELPVGVDISGDLDTEVRAARAGQVTYAGGDACCGNGLHVIIEHDDGYETLYGHLGEIAQQEGDAVSAGDTVGTVGMTGETDEPHLHFELRRNGVFLDPLSFLP